MFVKVKFQENRRNEAILRALKIFEYYTENLKLKSGAASRKAIERYQKSLTISENVRIKLKTIRFGIVYTRVFSRLVYSLI